MLSGVERNRLLLARLFARPANLLVLDEPTNDLDIESLELLEETLQGYAGTLLLVSHDRAFLDNVVTQTLVAEGGGKWQEYAGGYSDWVLQRQRGADAGADDGAVIPARSTDEPRRSRGASSAEPGTAERGDQAPASTMPVRVKLSFKEQRELESLPAELEALEREQHEITARMCAPDYHRHGPEAHRRDRARAEEVERLLAVRFERWAALEDRAAAAAKGKG